MQERVDKILEEKLRPTLLYEGSDLQIVAITDNTLTLKLVGAGAGSPEEIERAQVWIERTLKQAIPEITKVVVV